MAAELADRARARRETMRSGFATQPDPHLLDAFVQTSLRMPTHAAVACYRAILLTDLTPLLEHFAVPVRQITGFVDSVHAVEGTPWLQKRLHDARLIKISER